MPTRHGRHTRAVKRYAVAGYRDPDNVHIAIVGKGKARYVVSIPISQVKRLLEAPLFKEISLRSEMTDAVLQHLVDQGFVPGRYGR